MNPDDLAPRPAGLHAYGKPNSAARRADRQRRHGISSARCSRLSRNHATIGVMSIMPMRGTTRCSGEIIHCVITYDHRTHFEYAEIGSHDDNTRTSSANRKRPNVHDRSIFGNAHASSFAAVYTTC